MVACSVIGLSSSPPTLTGISLPSRAQKALGSSRRPHTGTQHPGELDEAVRTWLAQPGPAVLQVKVKPMQLVSPPSPFVSPEAVIGMAVYTAKAVLQGKGHDVWEMVTENVK
jgi:pyruvate dehydrogenase (quinone)